MRHGGKILADQLAIQGVKRVFSVPGESFLAALDGLFESEIENVVTRHEGGAAMMAEAYGKLTGKPGVVFVTRGPGATNASSGIHIAKQDSTPMIVFVGQIAREHRDREAFQEVDYRAFFGPIAKWVAEIDQIERLPEYISRAFHIAVSGRPGPVVLALPEDMLSSLAGVPDITRVAIAPEPDLKAQAVEILEQVRTAKSPLVVVGGSGWTQKAASDLAQFADIQGLPVAVAFRRQDYMDNRLLNYVGDLGVGMNPALGARLKNADCVLVIGSRFGDIVTGGYELVQPENPDKTILHVHPDPDELGRVFRPDLAVVAQSGAMISALSKCDAVGDWSAQTRAARSEYEVWQAPKETPGDVKLERVVSWLSDTLPETAIVSNGAGNYAAWLHRYFRFKTYGTQLAPTSGSMGYGFPAAISAALEHPDRIVVCMAGDGCIQMTINEFSTAVQHGANVIVVVVNNGRYGTIRMHQEKNYPGRVSGTMLANPDYAALATAYGGYGELVTRDTDFPAAFNRARASGKPSIIELRMDVEALSTGMTLTETRTAAQRDS